MYTSIRRYKTDPRNVREITKRAGEGFIPIISQVPGFIAYYIVDGGNGSLMSISIFKDRAAADESNQRAATWVNKHLGPLVPHPPEITSGEVLVHKSRS
jgi:hypothetical protein